VSNVDCMDYMFAHTNFLGDLSKWNPVNAMTMKHMFDYCPLEKNPPAWYKN